MGLGYAIGRSNAGHRVFNTIGFGSILHHQFARQQTNLNDFRSRIGMIIHARSLSFVPGRSTLLFSFIVAQKAAFSEAVMLGEIQEIRHDSIISGITV